MWGVQSILIIRCVAAALAGIGWAKMVFEKRDPFDDGFNDSFNDRLDDQ
ncbi:MAG: hypothetical protein WCO31_03340 [Actinomycetes bacterium]